MTADAAAHPTAAQLHAVDLLEELDDAALTDWVAATTLHEFDSGHIVVDQGDEPRGVWLLLEGTVRTIVMDGARAEPVGLQHAPTWMGAIAVVTAGTVGARMLVEEPATMGLIESAAFVELAIRDRSVFARVMRQIAPVMSRIQAIEQGREHLASLGTMAAGLAHELNNPAAAAKRAAAQMGEALDVLSSTLGSFVESGVEREQAQALVALQRDAIARAQGRTALDALDAADAEDALADVLDELGAEGWRLAPALAAAGVDEAWAREVAQHAGAATGAALDWVAATLEAQGLAGELRESAERMSSLVGAVKTYAYMDRGSVVQADVHEGLETTLVVLGHKLKHTSIEVRREYDRSLPAITMHGSELNQVWTNLLDNAIDALGETGTITLRTARDGDCVLVEIADDGPGIPEAERDRVFEPFFTTKGVGQGTGLGLDTARRIVVDRSDGSIALESEPGQGTTFRVWLPLGVA